MHAYVYSWVKTVKIYLSIQNCSQSCQQLSASNACMLATFSISNGKWKDLGSTQTDQLVGIVKFWRKTRRNKEKKR